MAKITLDLRSHLSLREVAVAFPDEGPPVCGPVDVVVLAAGEDDEIAIVERGPVEYKKAVAVLPSIS